MPSGLIAYRIWAVNRQTKNINVGTLVPVAVAVVESGLVYAISVVIQFALFLSNSGGYKIMQDIVSLLFPLYAQLLNHTISQAYASYRAFHGCNQVRWAADFELGSGILWYHCQCGIWALGFDKAYHGQVIEGLCPRLWHELVEDSRSIGKQSRVNRTNRC